MGSLIEMLASKKKPLVQAPAVEPSTVILPVLRKEHEGSCGENCGCSGEGESGCCGG